MFHHSYASRRAEKCRSIRGRIAVRMIGRKLPAIHRALQEWRKLVGSRRRANVSYPLGAAADRTLIYPPAVGMPNDEAD